MGLLHKIWDGVWTGTVASIYEALMKIPRMMVMTRILGPEWYGLLGLFGMARDVAGTFAQLGTGDAIIHHLAAAKAADDTERMGATLGAAGIIRLCTLFVLVLGVVLFRAEFVELAQDLPALASVRPDTLELIIVLLTIGVAVQIIEGPFGNALQGAQAWRALLVVRIINITASTILAIAAALLGLHLIGIVAAQQVGFIITAGVVFWFYLRYVRSTLKSPTFRQSLAEMRPVLLFALPLVLGQLFRYIYTYTDQLMLAAIGKAVAELSYYEVARNAAGMLAFVPTLLRSVMFPAASEFKVGRSLSELEALFAFMSKHLCWIMAPLALWMTAVSSLAIRVVAGEQYAVAAPALSWLAALMVINGFGVSLFTCLVGALGRTREQFVIEASGGGLNVALNYLLIPEYGFMGAVYATVTVKALGLMLGSFLLSRHMRLLFPARQALVCLVSATALGGVLWCAMQLSDWLVFLLLPFVAAGYLWSTVRFGVLDAQDLEYVNRLAGKLLARVAVLQGFVTRHAVPVMDKYRI
ncbi:flippase [Desulfovibrio mangrovi]|uniref:flippase n=1 Tax=Desulfovibrio mangrovi TaxID=2976983 RepID=UPI00224534E9|nr:flippase [Desulfovibrio mangrovi]UZP67555.1 flippase [Desulfovibrio mangrovi]